MVYLNLSAFSMPANRSYDMFLLGRGTELSLITQSIIQPQPTTTITHDTQLFLSKTIAKTSEQNCEDITISEKMDCIIDKIEEDLMSKNISCLPFHYYNVFRKLPSEVNQCKDDSDLVMEIHAVRNIHVDTRDLN